MAPFSTGYIIPLRRCRAGKRRSRPSRLEEEVSRRVSPPSLASGPAPDGCCPPTGWSARLPRNAGPQSGRRVRETIPSRWARSRPPELIADFLPYLEEPGILQRRQAPTQRRLALRRVEDRVYGGGGECCTGRNSADVPDNGCGWSVTNDGPDCSSCGRPAAQTAGAQANRSHAGHRHRRRVPILSPPDACRPERRST